MSRIKSLLAAIALAIAVPLASSAQVITTVPYAAHNFAGYERLTLSTGSAAALASIPAADGARPVRFAWIVVEGGDIRFRFDGSTTAPTAAIGIPIKNGGDLPLLIDATQLAKLRFIRQGSVSVDIWVSYFY